VTTPNQPKPDGAYELGGGPYLYGKNHTEATIEAITRGRVLPKYQGAQNAFDTFYNTPLDIARGDIDDHTGQIETLRAEFDTITIHGVTRNITSNYTYLATQGTIRADVIVIGGGAGGGAGVWNAIVNGNRIGGYGGGGGGEVHFTIHGAALFNTDGTSRPIPILMGSGGAGASVNEGNGTGGGNTSIDGIIAYGGQGGTWGGNGAGGGGGGFGMVPGGFGANGSPDSLSNVELYGGGGAGGRGATGSSGTASVGGRGGLNPGGTAGQPAPAAKTITATGGGGGGGGVYQGTGGAGAAPGGGGGGGGGGSNTGNWGRGGVGATGIVLIIERMV
jgi:hypothetical protein